MSWLSYIVSEWTFLIGLILFTVYKWSTSTYDFFKNKNVPFVKPVPLFGNFKGMLLQTEPMFTTVVKICMEFKDKSFFGIFEMRNPLLVIRDPELIKLVTVKDFDYFVNHRIFFDEKDEPLIGGSLMALKDQKWRDMRATLSPAFTGSKMRQMFQLVEEVCGTAVQHLKQQTSENKSLVLDTKEFFTRFTNDVIASTAFGIKIDSFSEKDNEFYKMGRKALNFSGFMAVKIFLFTNFKKLMQLLKVRLFDEKFSKYFRSLVLDTMKYRKDNNIIRPDMINLLMEARKGNLKHTENDDAEKTDGFATVKESTVGLQTTNRNWTDSDIVAQCFLFFLAGFEPTSVLMCFAAHELMANPEIQKKLIQEIDDVKEELNGKPLTYEVVQKMKYLDMVISETLRKWPAAVAGDRVCAKPYKLVDKNSGVTVQIDKGDCIWIPVVGLHHDPKFFPNPDKFDPERFSDENKHNIKPFTYLPFGVGPRNCIGSRFALMEAKAMIFHIFSEFTLEVSPKTRMPLELSAAGFQLKPKGGFWIEIKPRK